MIKDSFRLERNWFGLPTGGDIDDDVVDNHGDDDNDDDVDDVD